MIRTTDVAETVADRLRAARRRRFVGRTGELELVRSALDADESPFTVLYVHGPGGVGKSALLAALGDVVVQAGGVAVRLDARGLEPSPEGFVQGLLRAVGQPPGADPTAALQRLGRPVLLIDTYERIAMLDGWLREEFLGTLPAHALVIIAGRRPPDGGWATDPGWRDLLRVLSLRNLPPGDARVLLQGAGVADDLHEEALALTHGHPLALTLLADVLARGRDDDLPPTLAGAPNVVHALLDRFVDAVPSTLHRAALAVCAHVRFTTEPLLRDALDCADATEVFGWLRGLSFVEEGPLGLFPHDIARDALEADLHWRDAATHADLHLRIRGHISRRILHSAGRDQQRWASEAAYLNRHNPAVAPFWDWSSFGRAYGDAYRSQDRERLLEMTTEHQGIAQGEWVDFWLRRQPEQFLVVRASSREPIGFMAQLALHRASQADIEADPGTRAMWAYAMRYGPPRTGESVYAARFLVDAEAGQRPSATHNAVTFYSTQQWMTQRNVSWEFLGVYADGDFWQPLMDYVDFHRADEAAYEVGGVRYTVFARDWRRRDIALWREVVVEREIGVRVDPPPVPQPVLVLSQPDFAEAVRAALRDLHNAGQLTTSPLLQSRVVRDRAAKPMQALREVITETAQSLREDYRGEKPYAAIDRTYLRPAPTQERAAEILDLPFSTYRRHLTRGVEQIVEKMWQRELYGSPPDSARGTEAASG